MAVYNPHNSFDVQKFKEACQRLLAQDNLIELKTYRPRRSSQQNKYLHAILSYFAVEFGYSLDEVKVDFFKRLCNASLFQTTIRTKRGEHQVLRSTRELSTEEMTLAIERFRNYCASEAGLYIPSPEEHGHLRYIQQLIKDNDEHL